MDRTNPVNAYMTVYALILMSMLDGSRVFIQSGKDQELATAPL